MIRTTQFTTSGENGGGGLFLLMSGIAMALSLSILESEIQHLSV